MGSHVEPYIGKYDEIIGEIIGHNGKFSLWIFDSL